MFTDLVRTMEIQRYAVAESQERQSLDELTRNGVEILPLSDSQYLTIKEKVMKTVWPEMSKEIGMTFDTLTR